MKGKEAAQAAHRRVTALEAELQAVRADYERRLAEAAVESRDLKTQIAGLNSHLERGVQQLADARVSQVSDELEQRHAAALANLKERLLEGCAYISKRGWQFPPGDFERFCGIVGVGVGEAFRAGDVADNRTSRRATVKSANTTHALRAEAKARGIGLDR